VRYDLQWKNSWRYGDGSNGSVVHVAIRNGGSDYTDGVHDIVFSGGNASENATAKVKVTSGKISEIIEFTGGKDYVLSPTGFTGLSTSGVEAVFDAHIAS
jgi:broad specificity polyphosphatase/5'/3'-nucleotidase SurE